MAARDAFNETVQPKPAEIVRHRARRIGAGISALQLRHVITEVPMAKARGREGEETEGVHECMNAAVAEAEPGGPLIVHVDRRGDGVRAVFPDQAVVAQ